MSIVGDIEGMARKQRAPFTLLVLGSLIVSALILFSTRHTGRDSLSLWSGSAVMPWKFLTYPWAFKPLGNGGTLLMDVFLLIWYYQVGTGIEREMRTARYIGFWFVVTALGGVVIWAAATTGNSRFILEGPLLPISATTVAWCVRNRFAVVNLYGVIPLNAIFIGWAFAVITLLSFAAGGPALGIAACIPLAVTYFFAADRISMVPFAPDSVGGTARRKIDPKRKEATTRGQVQYDQSYFDDVKRREQERAEKERLRKLLGEEEDSP